jgi:hypothetical protein
MYRYYHVFLGRKHFDMVKALTPENACSIVYAMYGDPASYSCKYTKYSAAEA